MSQLTGHRRQFCLRTVIFSKMYDSLQDSKDTESVSLGEQCVMPTVEGSQRKVLIWTVLFKEYILVWERTARPCVFQTFVRQSGGWSIHTADKAWRGWVGKCLEDKRGMLSLLSLLFILWCFITGLRIQTHFSLLSDLTKSGKSKLGVSWWRGGVGLFALHQK